LKIKGAALLKLNEPKKASEALKLAIAQNQKNPSELYYLLASCYHEFKQPDKEIDSLMQALKGDPHNTSYLKELGAIYVTQNQLDKAKQTLEKAVSVAPADGELHFRLGQIFAREQETDNAIASFSKALDRGYVNTESLGERGKLYYYKHLYGSAKADFEDALDRTPDDKEIKRLLDLSDRAIADAKARVGTRKMPQEAAATVAAEQLPVNELQGDYVGRAYEEMKTGKVPHAIKLLKAAVKVNPNDVRARKYLASSLYAIGDSTEAATQFAYAGAQEQLSPEERFMYGKALSSAGKQEQAMTVLQALVNEEPTFGQARIALIKVFENAGFRDHAREQCQIGIQQSRSQAELAEFKALMP
jgi:tetratricopeptide (TPR) repeat protein